MHLAASLQPPYNLDEPVLTLSFCKTFSVSVQPPCSLLPSASHPPGNLCRWNSKSGRANGTGLTIQSTELTGGTGRRGDPRIVEWRASRRTRRGGLVCRPRRRTRRRTTSEGNTMSGNSRPLVGSESTCVRPRWEALIYAN